MKKKNELIFSWDVNLRLIPNYSKISSLIVFEKHNLLIVEVGKENYLYFKN